MRRLPVLLVFMFILPLAATAAPYRTGNMQQAIDRYERIAAQGGWPQISDGRILERGDDGPRVDAVIERLMAEDYLPRPRDTYDAEVEQAVRDFQRRSKLAIDGKVGPETREAMNITAEQRVQQLSLNLERMRSFEEKHLAQQAQQAMAKRADGPVDQDRYILVNVPDYRVHLIENGRSTYDARAIAGSYWWPTPTVHSHVRRLIINPAWNVPEAIAVNEIAPAIAEDPGLIEKKGYRLYKGGWTKGREPVDPHSIDWSQVTRENFDYFLSQAPGDENPLGRVQLHFPNEHNIFLHDTHKDKLFEQNRRDISHGCVRVGRPFKLAHLITSKDQRFESLLETGRTHEIMLDQHVPIHIVYWTAWVDEDGRAVFRNDVYEKDGIG